MSTFTSLWRSVTGPGEPPSEEQLRHYDQQRAALLKRVSLAVKQVQLDSCHIEGDQVGKSSRVIKDGQDANQLLHSFEAILQHGLIEGVLSFGMKPTFWPLVERISHKESIQTLSRLHHVTTTSGRCRAWLRLAANESSLQSYILVLCGDKELLRERYEPHAFLLDDDNAAVLCNLLNGVNMISFSLTVDHPSLEFEPATDTLPADKLRLTALQMQAAADASTADKERLQATAKADQSLLQQLEGQQRREEEEKRRKEEEVLARERFAEERRQRELSNHRQEDLEKKLAEEQGLRLQQERLLLQQRQLLEKLRSEATAAEDVSAGVTGTPDAVKLSTTVVRKTSGSPTPTATVTEGTASRQELCFAPAVVQKRDSSSPSLSRPKESASSPGSSPRASTPESRPHPKFNVKIDEDDDELVRKKKRLGRRSSVGKMNSISPSTSASQCDPPDSQIKPTRSERSSPATSEDVAYLQPTGDAHAATSQSVDISSEAPCNVPGGLAGGGSPGEGTYHSTDNATLLPASTGTEVSTSEQAAEAANLLPGKELDVVELSYGDRNGSADMGHDEDAAVEIAGGGMDGFAASADVGDSGGVNPAGLVDEICLEGASSAVSLDATADTPAITDDINTDVTSLPESERDDPHDQSQKDYESYLATLMRGPTTVMAPDSSSEDEDELGDRVGDLDAGPSKTHLWFEASIRSEVFSISPPQMTVVPKSEVKPIPEQHENHLTGSQDVMGTTVGSYVVVATAESNDGTFPPVGDRIRTRGPMGTTPSPLASARPATINQQRIREWETRVSGEGNEIESDMDDSESDGDTSSAESETGQSSGSSHGSSPEQQRAGGGSSALTHSVGFPHQPGQVQPMARTHSSPSLSTSASPPVRVALGNGQHQWHGLEEERVQTATAAGDRNNDDDEEDDTFVMLSLVDINDDHFARPETVGEHATIADLEVAIEHRKQRVRTCVEAEKEELVAEIIQLRLRLLQLVESADTSEEQKVILGHRFVRKSKRPGSKSTCDRCGAIIWRMLQPWYRCAECHYNSHAKCLGDISRTCVRDTSGQQRALKTQSFITEICPERGLGEQQYMCFECRRRISFSQRRNYLEARLCDYTGKYYCPYCHWNDLAVIPARIVHNWDFEPQKVCRSSLEVLTLMSKRACLSVGDVNSMLYNYVGDLSTVKQLRQEILIMKEYFVQCPQAKKEMLLRQLENRQHYVESSHLFTLAEFLELNSGTLLPDLQHICSNFTMHIKAECQNCRDKGNNCTLCHSEEIIFRFDSHCVLCSRCQTVYHRACLQPDVACPKCRKRQSRMP